MTTIGLIGAGHIGSQLARLAVKNGYDVAISNSRGPESLKALVAELLQEHLPATKVVKAFNHIYAAALTTDGQPAGSKNRRALAIAGNDPAAKATVARLIDEFGFDTVDMGDLKESWRIQRDTPGYGPRRNAKELRENLAAAKRPAGR